MRESFKVSAPGKLMILGEHAVLRGKLCVVAAVNQRISIIIKPRPDAKINIHSELGHYSSELDNLFANQKFTFVLAAIQKFKNRVPSGFDLTITSGFSHNVGLGSSAAVTSAMLAGLSVYANNELDKNSLFQSALEIIRDIQGTGSGADLAAGIFGGVLAYRMQPLEIQNLPHLFPITVIYSGHKTPTVKVIEIVNEREKQNPKIFARIFAAMDECSWQAVEEIRNQNWQNMGQLLNINQGLMDAIGVSDRNLAKIVYDLRQDPGIFGAKISGSGLGDCVIGVGKPVTGLSCDILPIELSSEGIRID